MKEIEEWLKNKGWKKEDNIFYKDTVGSKNMIINGQPFQQQYSIKYKIEYMGDGYIEDNTTKSYTTLHYINFSIYNNEIKITEQAAGVDSLQDFINEFISCGMGQSR